MKRLFRMLLVLLVFFNYAVLGKDEYNVVINYGSGPITLKQDGNSYDYKGEIPYECSKNATAYVSIINDDGSESFGGIWDYRDDEEGLYYDLKFYCRLPLIVLKIYRLDDLKY